MKLVMVNESDLETLADWWGSQPNVSQPVLDIIEKFVTRPGGEIFQVWTADDVELAYENVQTDREDDHQTGGSQVPPPPPPWTELTDAERTALVEAGRKALDYTEYTCDVLYDAVEDPMKELNLVGGKP